jgi:outer membrane protein assembly factor BamB
MNPPFRILAAALAFSLSVQAADWPQWRGPAFNGSSPESGLPESWTAADVKWSTPLPGISGATPGVSGDSVFVSSPDANQNLLLLCIDRKDGRIRWQKQIATGGIAVSRANMTSPSPVTDGKAVYIVYGTGDLAALDFDGNILWQRNLSTDYKRFGIQYFYGSSPLLYGDKLYLQVLQRSPAPADYPGLAGGDPERDSYLLAIDPATGKTLWKQVRVTTAKDESMEAYSSPVPHESGGKTQILIAGGDCLSAHDPATGQELWRGYGINRKRGGAMRVVTSPVSAGSLAVACGPKKEQAIAFRTDLEGDISEKGIAWSFDEKKTPDVCTPAFADGRLFVLDGDSQTLTSLEAATGAKGWQTSLGHRETIRSSPTVADGKVYTISEKGTVVVCATNDGRVLSTFQFETAEPTRAAVIVTHRQLLFRLADRLVCIGK